MRLLLTVSLLALQARAGPQGGGINFGGSGGQKPADITNRNYGQQTAAHHQQQQQEERCCCVPAGQQCLDRLTQGGGDDLVGQGLINERIVNRPSGAQLQTLTCSYGQRLCCYQEPQAPSDPDYDFSVFQRHPSCVAPSAGPSAGHTAGQAAGRWVQGCQETAAYGAQQCGVRSYQPARGLQAGEASPGEFPWTCLILNQNNDFLGSCAVVPETFSNDLSRGTRKILTAAHNLKKIGPNDRVKVRVGEYDASGFNQPETQAHLEYPVDRIVRHPQFDPKRLTNDIAVLRTATVIDLGHQYVSPACLPSCNSQFEHVFSNGTGVRCWTAGWGKDEFSGQFRFIQHKVDVPLVPGPACSSSLSAALNRQKPGVGDRFRLSASEVCAGTETGKDACTGDGGSPLVCQAQSGRWTVVGLVSWGIGCATELPGVYTRVHHFKDWINRN